LSILLVRHGQASAGSEDYDCLSARGEEQCRRLGAWLARTGHDFDAVLVGAMKRHAQSAQAVGAGYLEAGGRALPAAEVDAGLDEFDHHAVFSGYARSRADQDIVRRAAAEGLSALAPLIQAALGAWMDGSLGELPESWPVFGERVRAAGARLAARRGQRLLVLTSGGVVSRLAQAAMGAQDRAVVDFSMALRNSALSEFHARDGALALSSFNALPHLHDARELWTYY
jgi:broad specificity phosphatase PhoE